jgi:2-polyprenyl-3-methyl-5-hydroxy-6-metoxy-1,4-benzoquinol methylase
MSFDVIEHVYNYKMFMEECIRVLKKGGLLVIGTMNFSNKHYRKCFYDEPTHVKPYTLIGLYRLFTLL